MAGQGSVIGSMIEELKDIKDQVVPEKQKYIGFCIDTAHIWGKGLYDLREIEEINKMFRDLENILDDESDENCIKCKKYTELSTSIKSIIDNL